MHRNAAITIIIIIWGESFLYVHDFGKQFSISPNPALPPQNSLVMGPSLLRHSTTALLLLEILQNHLYMQTCAGKDFQSTRDVGKNDHVLGSDPAGTTLGGTHTIAIWHFPLQQQKRRELCQQQCSIFEYLRLM
jgi:hypothetical protein